MFTGIIEEMGKVVFAKPTGGNLSLVISCSFSGSLKPGDSINHNGVCLTVEKISGNGFTVSLVPETLKRSNLGSLKPGDLVNLERALPASGRFNGHFVQGHVDGTTVCTHIARGDGHSMFYFRMEKKMVPQMVMKGSICVNGVSLTIAGIDESFFSVALVPFTLENTNFATLSEGDSVNLEFDLLGKYVARQVAAMQLQMFVGN